MSIKFACECGKAYKVPDKFAGKRVRCKNCGETVAVPSASEQISSARAAAVSNRSVVSGRHREEEDDDDDDGDDDEEAPRVPSGAKPLGKPSISAKHSPAAATAAAKSHRMPAISERRKGGDTQRVDVADIMTEAKRYQKKRDDDSIPKGMGKLTLFEGGKATKSFRVDKAERKIGRGSACEVRLEDPSVSKEHALLEYKLGTYIATDAKSLNGLYVNGKQVRRASLRDGDLIQLGEVVLRFEMGK